MAPKRARPRPETAPCLRTEDESCAARTGSCRRSRVRAHQRAHHHRHHAAADLDPRRHIAISAVLQQDVDDAAPAHLRPLFAGDGHASRVWDQPVRHSKRAEWPAGRPGCRVLVYADDVRGEHAAAQPVRAVGREKKNRQRLAAVIGLPHLDLSETAESTACRSFSAMYRNSTPVLATCSGTSGTRSLSWSPMLSAMRPRWPITSPNVSGGWVIQNVIPVGVRSPRTGTGPTLSSSVNLSAPPKTRPCVARTHAVPTVGCPAKGSSVPGVKMRTRAA